MKFVCEFCKKSFDNAEEAKECERLHNEENSKLLKRKNHEQKISDAINAFMDYYKDAPAINLTDENKMILGNKISNDFGELFAELFGEEKDERGFWA